MELKNVIARLKGDVARTQAANRLQGNSAGVRWATERAGVKELERLYGARDENYDWYFGVGESAYSDAEHFVFEAFDVDGDREAASDFWESELGTNWDVLTSTEFVQGFAEGAMSIWAEVRGLVSGRSE